MKNYILVLAIGVLYSSTSLARECSIQLGGGGKNSAVYTIKKNKEFKSSNLGSPWDFIRYAKGPCRFTLYNKKNYKGRRVQYGVIGTRQRIGSKDDKDKGGWKGRSLIITPLKTNCKIQLVGYKDKTIWDNIKETGPIRSIQQNHHSYYGPSNFSHISALSGVKKTSGNSSCQYTLYNDYNFAGRQITVGKVNRKFRVDWRIRSMKITNRK